VEIMHLLHEEIENFGWTTFCKQTNKTKLILLIDPFSSFQIVNLPINVMHMVVQEIV
jgi:hypothetical protein